ncbi:MAG: biotin/lipoyl-containing protein, partial [Mariprofundaceae bacterium]
MPIDVYMTQLSPTMTEGKIVRWLKKEGDALESGEVLAEVETDKATMELEVVDEGVLHKILQPEGSVVPVGEPIAVIAEEGEEVPDDYVPEGGTKPEAASEPEPQPEPPAPQAAARAETQAAQAPSPAPAPKAGRIKA